ncbi:MAG TPA: hypothetical protein VG871_11165 [Vicinamibacterales bacterium]|nr:hypothetical protein [Vicinamibacterales bacterium]
MTRLLRTALVLGGFVLLLPSPARADWLLSLYTGAAATSSNTLTVTPSTGAPITLSNVAYRGASSKAPIYYGYRVGWSPRGARFGVEGEFTHAKAIAVDTHSPDLTIFQMTHGLNFVLGNIVYRAQPLGGGRVALTARGGAGFTVPHVEADFRNTSVSKYESGGFGAQGTVGVEALLTGRLYVIADARLTYARVRVDIPSAALAGGFTTRHVDVGIAVRLP